MKCRGGNRAKSPGVATCCFAFRAKRTQRGALLLVGLELRQPLIRRPLACARSHEKTQPEDKKSAWLGDEQTNQTKLKISSGHNETRRKKKQAQEAEKQGRARPSSDNAQREHVSINGHTACPALQLRARHMHHWQAKAYKGRVAHLSQSA